MIQVDKQTFYKEIIFPPYQCKHKIWQYVSFYTYLLTAVVIFLVYFFIPLTPIRRKPTRGLTLILWSITVTARTQSLHWWVVRSEKVWLHPRKIRIDFLFVTLCRWSAVTSVLITFVYSHLLFSSNETGLRANTFNLSSSLWLIQTIWGRRSNPSSVSLSWVLIPVPDAPGSSANPVCVRACVCAGSLNTH